MTDPKTEILQALENELRSRLKDEELEALGWLITLTSRVRYDESLTSEQYCALVYIVVEYRDRLLFNKES